MFNLETLVDVVALVAASKRERAVLWQDASGEWHPMSSRWLRCSRVCPGQYLRSTGALPRAIVSRCWRRIAGSGQWWTLPPWFLARSMYHYPTLTAEQIASLLIDSGARVAVVSTEAQYRKVASIRGQTELEHILVMDQSRAWSTLTTLSSLLENAGAHIRSRYATLAAQFCRQAAGSGHSYLYFGHHR